MMKNGEGALGGVFGLVLLAVCLALVAMGCVTAQKESPSEMGEKVERLAPGRVHEDCLEILEGQGISYWFRANGPLDFNIHYHDDGEISYPVTRKGASNYRGEFTSKRQQYYCLMWTNSDTSGTVRLRYGYSEPR